MKPEFEQRLHAASREHLIQLLEELALRHPVLLTEITSMLENVAHELPQTEDASDDTGDAGEVSEDWDFNGDTQLHSLPSQQATILTGNEARNHYVDEFSTRLQQAATPQELFDVLRDLIEDAVSYIGRSDGSTALDLFALLIDERLLERKPETVPLFDEMIDAGMYSLEALLGEVNSTTSYTLFDVDTAVALLPLLTPAVRHRWLERLFALWLKRLDAHQVEEDLPELMLDVARSEDMLLLRSLVQNEIQQQPHTGHAEHANIVDFGHQYRSRALEKFLKELPRT